MVETNPQTGLSEEYLKLNRLGKTPTFVDSDGTVLTECMAIALHGITSRLVRFVGIANQLCSGKSGLRIKDARLRPHGLYQNRQLDVSLQ